MNLVLEITPLTQPSTTAFGKWHDACNSHHDQHAQERNTSPDGAHQTAHDIFQIFTLQGAYDFHATE
jgi:hypothetical protein